MGGGLRKPITVIGAGIVGLTTAYRLGEAGFDVCIRTAQHPVSTTSANAGAIWGPFLSTRDRRVEAWSFTTLAVLREAAANPATGVVLCNGVGAQRSGEASRWWVDGFEESRPVENIPRGYDRAWDYRVPIIDMPVYLSHLWLALAERGVEVRLEEVPTLDAVLDEASHVVVCAGMGSRALAADEQLIPSKGQLVVVDNPGLTTFFAERGDGPDLTYILPQGDQLVLGGTADWDFASSAGDDATSIAILARCAAIEPRLEGARIRGVRVGLRACRPSVRVEGETTASGHHIIYNYGHGGSGVSLSWGCAATVVDLAERSLIDRC
jgi:D-amino-acid oxidase